MGFVILKGSGPLNNQVSTWMAKNYILSIEVLAQVKFFDTMRGYVRHSEEWKKGGEKYGSE